MSYLMKLMARIDDKALRIIPGSTIMRLRIGLLKKAGASIGQDVFIGQGVRVLNPDGLTIEPHVNIARDTVLDARGGLTIRYGCLIGFETVLLTRTHNSGVPGIPVQDQGMYEKPIVLEANVWLGARVVLMPGVKIEQDTIVGTGSLVTKSLKETAIYGGTPARRISDR